MCIDRNEANSFWIIDFRIILSFHILIYEFILFSMQNLTFIQYSIIELLFDYMVTDSFKSY